MSNNSLGLMMIMAIMVGLAILNVDQGARAVYPA
jgi:hypothetical protein